MSDIDPWKPIAPEAPYETLALWQATEVGKDDDVEDFFLKQCDTRIKRVGCVMCIGGRCDFAFFVHRDDILKFAIQRVTKMAGDSPRWWEDIFFNEQQGEFPPEFVTFYPNPRM